MEEVIPGAPKPAFHVRWAAPKVQPKRNETSLPGAAGPGAKATHGPSQAPPPKLSTGCYASCSRCNQCSRCRYRNCNGGCTGCEKCRTCREWGKMLREGVPYVVSKHAEEFAKPEVEKRVAKDPGNMAKHAAAEAARAMRPKGAAPGSRPCPYCNKWLPHSHPENCPSMPYKYWVGACRARAETKYGKEVVQGWPVQCQHCATPFPSGASKRVHLPGCERRREEAGLPLNQYPAIRHRGL